MTAPTRGERERLRGLMASLDAAGESLVEAAAAGALSEPAACVTAMRFHTARVAADFETWLQGRSRESFAAIACPLPAETPPDAGVIYCLATPAALKIGYTQRGGLRFRVASLQVGCSETITVAHAVPGTMQEERRLHRHFAAFHVRGEWFERRDAIAEVFRRLALERGTAA